ncbi:MAG: ral nucleoside transport system ATP-binding protein [Acidimicrobiaceae bacterium]|nr:ral nucleoside transport system ATP-binding protein [Acidimicrobiaceae bacterium]MDQ1426553.1 ral nucleoside transport system ATP-binding protein [Acidimicrobiaceae bacterium]
MKLELRGITKRFGSVVANDHIDLTVEPGQIHALLGENGAGKSTLMNILYGLTRPDEGEILIDGSPVDFSRPKDAIAAGIGMVHQHFMLVPVFTVAENVVLGDERTRSFGRLGFGLLDRRRARQDVLRVSTQFGLAVDPDALVENLPVGIQQRVEIIKALLRDATLLILDEPTAVLTPGETEDLFAVMRSLKASGHSLVFITHKLNEVQKMADTITVIRQGKVVGTMAPTASDEELAARMVGRAVRLAPEKAAAKLGDVVLSVEGLTVLDDLGNTAVKGVSFDIKAGEILGIAGVQGNGQTELCEALVGLRPVIDGRFSVRGRDLTNRATREILHSGVGYVPEDRQAEGLVTEFTVAENLALDRYDQAPYSKGLALDLDVMDTAAGEQVKQFDIRTESIRTPASSLSGGNQQKVVVARELSRTIGLLIASQPTRGVDVGSIEFVHRRIVEVRNQGSAVLLVSTELDEIAALADRIAVMYEGEVVAMRSPDVTREELGLLMAGAGTGEKAAPAGAPA